MLFTLHRAPGEGGQLSRSRTTVTSAFRISSVETLDLPAVLSSNRIGSSTLVVRGDDDQRPRRRGDAWIDPDGLPPDGLRSLSRGRRILPGSPARATTQEITR
jgi:hypothetical protein